MNYSVFRNFRQSVFPRKRARLIEVSAKYDLLSRNASRSYRERWRSFTTFLKTAGAEERLKPAPNYYVSAGTSSAGLPSYASRAFCATPDRRCSEKPRIQAEKCGLIIGIKISARIFPRV